MSIICRNLHSRIQDTLQLSDRMSRFMNSADIEQARFHIETVRPRNEDSFQDHAKIFDRGAKKKLKC